MLEQICYQAQKYISKYNMDFHRLHIAKTSKKIEDSPAKKRVSKSILKFPSVKGGISSSETSNYIIGDIIGEGAFAKVKTCIRKSDGNKFVMKIYDKFRLTTEEKKKSIYLQIDILKCIKHESLILIVDSFETPETINIVMENFSHTSLSNYARQNRPLSQQVLRKIAVQIAQALTYLHNKKISHRDLKAENILINENNQIKLIDLGLAMMGDHSQMKLAGTPQYMCPELIYKKNYDPFKGDIWAFGILLYWLVLGYFPQDTEQKTKRKGSKLFNLKFPVDTHPGIEYLISKMLHEDPHERISAQQILEDTWLKPKDFKNEITKLIKTMSTKA